MASHVSPAVKYLATAGQPADRPSYATFEDFLAAHAAHLIPHRPWYNYWGNVLGFNDVEFEVPKPVGRFRIMAIGDSFAYGLVPYPDNVLTIVEERLRTRCACRDLDLLNFGTGATGPPDYKTLIEVAHSRYEPDLIAVHFYMGNDGPDLHAAWTGTEWRRRLPRSYAANYVANAWQLGAARILGGVRLPDRPAGRPARSMAPRGGAMIDTRQPPLTDRDPVMAAPTFADDVYLGVAKSELFRLYAPKTRPAHVEAAWTSTLLLVDALRRAALDRGSRFVMVLFPSALQVYPSLLATVVRGLHERGRFTDVALEDIDVTIPNRTLLGYCRRVNMPCVDVTPAFIDASRHSTEPLYRPGDTHWNIRGNHVAAEAEAMSLRPFVCQERSRC